MNNLGASERLSEHQLDDLLAMHVEPVLAESFETIQILVRAVVHFVASLSQRGVDSVVVIAEEEAGLVLSSSLVHQNVDQTVSNPLDQTELRSVLAVNVTVQRTGAEWDDTQVLLTPNALRFSIGQLKHIALELRDVCFRVADQDLQ